MKRHSVEGLRGALAFYESLVTKAVLTASFKLPQYQKLVSIAKVELAKVEANG